MGALGLVPGERQPLRASYAVETAARLHRASMSALAVEDEVSALLFRRTALALQSFAEGPHGEAEAWRWTPVVQAVLALAEEWPR